MSTPPLLLSAHTGGILRLTLNRPNARNALSSDLMTALHAALDGLEALLLARGFHGDGGPDELPNAVIVQGRRA